MSTSASTVPTGCGSTATCWRTTSPIVGFIAETDGVYRAVMTAASVEGGGMSYAGMIVLRVLDEGAGNEGGGR